MCPECNKEKIICPNCKTEKKIQIKETINSVDFKTEKEVKIIDDNSELSEEVEFDDDNELNEVLEDDVSLEKE